MENRLNPRRPRPRTSKRNLDLSTEEFLLDGKDPAKKQRHDTEKSVKISKFDSDIISIEKEAQQARNSQADTQIRVDLFKQLFQCDLLNYLFDTDTADIDSMCMLLETDILRDLPVTFESSNEYRNVFLPLIFQELKDSIKSNCRTNSLPIVVWQGNLHKLNERIKENENKLLYEDCHKMMLRFTVNTEKFNTKANYFRSSLYQEGTRTNGKRLIRKCFEKIKGRSENDIDGFGLKKGDVLVLSMNPNIMSKSTRKWEYVLGIVSRSPKVVLNGKQSDNGSDFVCEIGINLELYIPDQVETVFPLSSILTCWNLGNLITEWREYIAVTRMMSDNHALALNSSFIKGSLLNGLDSVVDMDQSHNAATDEISIEGITPIYLKYLKDNFNESQRTAIKASVMRKNGFSLIQGPPGTGKTHTLLGLLNMLHLNEFQKYYESKLPCLSPNRPIKRSHKRKPRILVTAPSNTAVREMAKRLLVKGFKDGTARLYHPRAVWFANASKHRTDSGPEERILLEQQVDLILNKQNDTQELIRENQSHIKQLQEMKKRILELETAIEAAARVVRDLHKKLANVLFDENSKEKLKQKIEMHEKKYHEYAGHLIHLWERVERYQIKFDCNEIALSHKLSENDKRRQLRVKFLAAAQIVFVTLSSSAIFEVKEVGIKHGFNVVVIDEAAQSVEPAVLIPMQYNCDKCILVGDHMQLPATVVSESSKEHMYQQSLFERLLKAGHDYHLLDVQYRCHPTISKYVSKEFYEKKLKNGANVISNDYHVPENEEQGTTQNFDTKQMKGNFDFSQVFSPLLFLSIKYGKEEQNVDGRSYYNMAECRAVLNIYKMIRSQERLKSIGIGIISPYAQQISRLKQQFTNYAFSLQDGKKLSLKEFDPQLELNTVDGYQGREFDIIIVSAVRAEKYQESVSKLEFDPNEKHHMKSIGFLNDERRLNVAITRAKYSLIVVGQENKLKFSKLWGKFIRYIKHNGKFFTLFDDSSKSWNKFIKFKPRKRMDTQNAGEKANPESKTLETLLTVNEMMQSISNPAKEVKESSKVLTADEVFDKLLKEAEFLSALGKPDTSSVESKEQEEEHSEEHAALEILKALEAAGLSVEDLFTALNTATQDSDSNTNTTTDSRHEIPSADLSTLLLDQLQLLNSAKAASSPAEASVPISSPAKKGPPQFVRKPKHQEVNEDLERYVKYHANKQNKNRNKILENFDKNFNENDVEEGEIIE